MTRGAAIGVAFALARVLVACDETQAIHELDLDTNRMMQQKRADPYAQTGAFADGRVMQRPPDGTVRHDVPPPDPLLDDGTIGGVPATRIPIPVTRALLLRGRARFETTCATCHGIAGDGDSVVARKMTLRKPPSLQDATIATLAPGALFQVATKGYGMMPGYADLLDRDDRWAVVAYVEALLLSRRARVAELAPEDRAALAREAP